MSPATLASRPPTAADWDTPVQQTVRRLVDEFPLELPLLFDLGSARVLSVPRVSSMIADKTRYVRAGDRRHAVLSEAVMGLMRSGHSSPFGRRIIERLADVHEGLGIADEEVWYALMQIVIQPIGGIDRVGWRPLEPHERDALFRFWQAVGIQWGLGDAPTSLAEAQRRTEEFERRHFALAPSNKIAGDVARREWSRRFPRGLRWFADAVYRSFIDEPMRQALDLPSPGRWTRRAVFAFFQLRRRLLAAIPRLRRASWLGGRAVLRPDPAEFRRFLDGPVMPAGS